MVESATASAGGDCLVERVDRAMSGHPGLEAVRFDRERRLVAYAANPPGAARETLEREMGAPPAAGAPCPLRSGEASCDTCPRYGDLRGGRVAVASDGPTTTMLRAGAPRRAAWSSATLPWPTLTPLRLPPPDEGGHEGEWRWQLAAAALCGVGGLAGWLSGGSPWGWALAYAAGSWFTFGEVWEGLRERKLDVHFLMLAVAAGAAAIGAWGEGSLLLFLFSLSGALEHYAMGRTEREIRSLFKAAPKQAIRLGAGGAESVVPVSAIQRGDLLLIKPGEQFPVDGHVAGGETAADESTLTGEAAPVEKRRGDEVFAGTLNLWGAARVVAARPAGESALQKIIQLIRDAQRDKAPSQSFTDRFGTRYTWGVLALTAAMFFVWWLGFGLPPFKAAQAGGSAFYKAMTLLVVASPCALVLSIPSAILAAIAWAARRGVLFRGGAAVEQLADITVVAMDKTGTLTTGELRVDRVEAVGEGGGAELLRLAVALESLSNHPLARAVALHGRREGVAPAPVEEFESVTGLGLKGRVEGRPVWVGKRSFVEANGAGPLAAGMEPPQPGLTEVWVHTPGLAGRLLLRDDLRPEAPELAKALRARGLRSIVLTGDRLATAELLRSHVPVDEVRAELTPGEKVEIVTALAKSGERVAMIGDGVNDAPSLAAASVGVAMGARGSDAALEQADVVLMHDRLENFLTAHRLSQRARRVIRQNLAISLASVVLLALGAILGWIPLSIGVLGHEGSTVVVVFNSLRLLLASDQG